MHTSKGGDMVKNILGIMLSIVLLVGISVYEIFYIEHSFYLFGEELQTLYDKTEQKHATVEDAKAIRSSWDAKKQHMHVWIPHNDISYVDYWLNETIGLIYVKDYEHALPKLEVLLEICDKIPSAYAPSFENVF